MTKKECYFTGVTQKRRDVKPHCLPIAIRNNLLICKDKRNHIFSVKVLVVLLVILVC